MLGYRQATKRGSALLPNAFVNRRDELANLEKEYRSEAAAFVVVYKMYPVDRTVAVFKTLHFGRNGFRNP